MKKTNGITNSEQHSEISTKHHRQRLADKVCRESDFSFCSKGRLLRNGCWRLVNIPSAYLLNATDLTTWEW